MRMLAILLTVAGCTDETPDNNNNNNNNNSNTETTPATEERAAFADEDGDGFGDDATERSTTEPLAENEVLVGGDCDDADATVNPDAVEICDDLDTDEDCSGAADDDDSGATGQSSWYADSDEDGFGDDATGQELCDAPAGHVADNTDCDDGSSSANPGLSEVCDPDDVDEDCSGEADDDDDGATGQTTWYADFDTDGFGDPLTAADLCDQPVDYVADASDCDDTDIASHPLGEDTCDDGVDQDCSGVDLACDTFDMGGLTSSWDRADPRFRGHVFWTTVDSVVVDFGFTLGFVADCTVDFYIHESANASGPWTVVWTDSLLLPAGSEMRTSPRADVEILAGSYYGLGLGWNCAAEYFGDDGGWAGNYPLGDFVWAYWENNYSPDPTFSPTQWNPDASRAYSSTYRHAP